MDLNGKLKLHPDFRHETVRIGNEGAPVLIVDNFLSDPKILIDYVVSQSVFKPADASYPGVRATVPQIYLHALRLFLGEIVQNALGLEDSQLVKGFSGFSLVTTPPGQLSLVQRLPHCDSDNPKQVALLHYLCPSGKGGTGFYRHRRTGYEQIGADRVAAYTDSVNAELMETGMPAARYIDGSTAQFERIASFEPVFNRVLVYRSISLHSANIAPDFDFDPDPRTGRLTINMLFTFR